MMAADGGNGWWQRMVAIDDGSGFRWVGCLSSYRLGWKN